MGRYGLRGEIRSRLTKLQLLFRYPRSEPDCMTWSFPRQINLPPIRSPREAMPPVHRAARRCHSGKAEVTDNRGVSVGP